MTIKGIQAIYLTTHNWGKAAKFFQELGYTLEFETDHNSGQLRAETGPYLFIAEVPETEAPQSRMVMRLAGEEDAPAGSTIEVVTPFADTHWGSREMTVRDPDGRIWNLETEPKG